MPGYPLITCTGRAKEKNTESAHTHIMALTFPTEYRFISFFFSTCFRCSYSVVHIWEELKLNWTNNMPYALTTHRPQPLHIQTFQANEKPILNVSKLKLAKFFHCTVIKPFLSTMQLFCHTTLLQRSTFYSAQRDGVCVCVFICHAQQLCKSSTSWMELCGAIAHTDSQRLWSLHPSHTRKSQ